MYGIHKTILETVRRIGYIRSAAISVSLAVIGATEGVALILLTSVFGQFSEPQSSLEIFANIGSYFNGTIGIPGLLVVFLIIVGVQQITEYLSKREVAKHAAIYLQETRIELLQAMQSARWEFVARQEVSKLRYAYTELPQIMADTNDLIMRLLVSGIVTFVAFCFLFQIEPYFATAVLIALFVLGSVFLRLDHRLKVNIEVLIKSQKQYLHRLEQIVSTLKIVKLTDTNGALSNNLRNAAVEHSDKIYSSWNLNQKFIAGYKYTLALLMAGFLFWAHQMEMESIRILILLAILARAMPRANMFQSSLRRLVTTTPYFEEFDNLVEDLLKNREVSSEDHFKPEEPLHTINAEGLKFGYRDGQPILDGVSINIKKGEAVGISGLSGAGKTTLCNILIGLLSPNSGTVSLNGNPIHESEMYRLRCKVAYVDQSELVFGGTLRENLLLGSTPISDEEIMSVFRELRLDEIVEQRPEGLDSQILGHGQALSGGQRQRIAIARALLSDKQFMVLDEFSSALEGRDQKLVLDAIFRRRETFAVLIISHRNEVLSRLDRRFILKDGKLMDVKPEPI